MVTQQELRKFKHACDLQLIFANKGKGMKQLLVSADVRWGGVRDEPKECLRGRLTILQREARYLFH